MRCGFFWRGSIICRTGQDKVKRKEAPHTWQVTYFSRLVDAEQFIDKD
jgi:hypothetical protein